MTPEAARTAVRTNATVIGALAVRRGEADALICGLEGRFDRHLRDIRQIIGQADRVQDFSTLSLLISSRGAVFLADTHVNLDPTRGGDRRDDAAGRRSHPPLRHRAEGGAALAFQFRLARLRQRAQDARALDMLAARAPDLEVDGEMHGDMALSEELRRRLMPVSRLSGRGESPGLPDARRRQHRAEPAEGDDRRAACRPDPARPAMPAHILTPSVTSRGVVNMTALAAVEAQEA